MIQKWLSPAKLNLFLYITGQNKNGYHLLQTLFQFLNYNDILTFNLYKGNEINLLTPINGILNKNNLIIKAAYLLKKYYNYYNKYKKKIMVLILA